MIEIETRFDRRYSDDGRSWRPCTDFDRTLLEFTEKEIIRSNEEVLHEELYVKHFLYCCGSTPVCTLCCEFNELQNVFKSAKAGDYIMIWSLSTTPRYYEFACPDRDGLFPSNGSY